VPARGRELERQRGRLPLIQLLRATQIGGLPDARSKTPGADVVDESVVMQLVTDISAAQALTFTGRAADSSRRLIWLCD
jgi:hypothetical protein